MHAGSYLASVNIVPSASGGPYRVGYDLSLITLEPSRTVVPLASGQIDLNANVGLPNSFQVAGKSISISQGPTLFHLYIGGVARHDNFGGQGNDGLVSIPAAVQLKLDKL